MSIRDYNKKLNLVLQDNITGEYRTIPIEKEYNTKTLWTIIESIATDNLEKKIGFKIDFLIVA